MTINVRLENANEDFLKAIKSMAKASGVKIKAKREYEPSDELLEAMAEAKEIAKNPHLYKKYSSVDEMFEDILK